MVKDKSFDFMGINAILKVQNVDPAELLSLERRAPLVCDFARAEEIESKLRARRDQLHVYTEDFYGFLSKAVDVVGTNERELFNVSRQENGDTQVSVFEMSDKM